MTHDLQPPGAPSFAVEPALDSDIETALVALLAALAARGVAMPAAQRGMLTKPQVAQRAGISMAGLDRLRARGEGPREIRISPRRVGFKTEDVESWLVSRRTGGTPVSAK